MFKKGTNENKMGVKKKIQKNQESNCEFKTQRQ